MHSVRRCSKLRATDRATVCPTSKSRAERLLWRALLSGEEDGGWQEKVNQIRVYSGEKFQSIEQAESGMVCAVTGLTHTTPGMGLGSAAGALPPVLEPVLGISGYSFRTSMTRIPC